MLIQTRQRHGVDNVVHLLLIHVHEGEQGFLGLLHQLIDHPLGVHCGICRGFACMRFYGNIGLRFRDSRPFYHGNLLCFLVRHPIFLPLCICW